MVMKEGAGKVKGADVNLYRVPETLTDEILGKMGALETQKGFARIPVCKIEDLAADSGHIQILVDNLPVITVGRVQIGSASHKGTPSR